MDARTISGLSSKQAAAWLTEQGFTLSDGERPAPVGSSGSRLSLDRRPSTLVALSDRILPVGWPDQAERACLVWIQQRGVWADYSEQVGLVMWTKLVSVTTDAVLFPAAHGLLAQAAMLCPIVFGWDALIVPDGARWCLMVNHDGTAVICAEDAGLRTDIQTRLDTVLAG